MLIRPAPAADRPAQPLARPAHAGFTLVELLITIAIVGVLVSLAFPSFRGWIQNTKIRTVTEGLQNGLQLARTEAVRRNTRVQFVLNADTSWHVQCVIAVGDSNGDGVLDCPGGTNYIQTRAAAEIGSGQPTITRDPTAATTIIFSGMGRVVQTTDAVAAPTAPLTRLDISVSASADIPSRPRRILIDGGGRIRTCDPTFAAPDPRAC